MKNRLNLIIIILYLFFIPSLDAQDTTSLDTQEIFSTDSLIGEWFYNGPEIKNLKINDTIILLKELNNKDEYTKWIFNSDNQFILFMKGSFVSRGITHYYESESKADTWYYNNEINILKIQRDAGRIEQHFRIFMYQERYVKLIMIK